MISFAVQSLTAFVAPTAMEALKADYERHNNAILAAKLDKRMRRDAKAANGRSSGGGGAAGQGDGEVGGGDADASSGGSSDDDDADDDGGESDDATTTAEGASKKKRSRRTGAGRQGHVSFEKRLAQDCFAAALAQGKCVCVRRKA